MLTKKAKLEQFDSLKREHDLLQRFFWDSCENFPVSAEATYRTKENDKFYADVYGVNRPDGGYIVIQSLPGTPSIAYWEEWQTKVREMPFSSEFCLAMKSLADQLRHQLYRKSA